MERSQLIELIQTVVEDYLASSQEEASKELGEETRLFGRAGLLDSLGLVSVVLDIEQELSEARGIELSLADDRAMSQERSPFRSIGTLADYALSLMNETGE